MNRDKFIEDVKEFINGAKKVENSYWKGKNIYSDEYYKQVEEYINKYCITILELFFQKGIDRVSCHLQTTTWISTDKQEIIFPVYFVIRLLY